jgi:hypothetical protein
LGKDGDFRTQRERKRERAFEEGDVDVVVDEMEKLFLHAFNYNGFFWVIRGPRKNAARNPTDPLGSTRLMMPREAAGLAGWLAG